MHRPYRCTPPCPADLSQRLVHLHKPSGQADLTTWSPSLRPVSSLPLAYVWSPGCLGPTSHPLGVPCFRGVNSSVFLAGLPCCLCFLEVEVKSWVVLPSGVSCRKNRVVVLGFTCDRKHFPQQGQVHPQSGSVLSVLDCLIFGS
jgi:hypothetical protein